MVMVPNERLMRLLGTEPVKTPTPRRLAYAHVAAHAGLALALGLVAAAAHAAGGLADALAPLLFLVPPIRRGSVRSSTRTAAPRRKRSRR
jgi:hypothetical protein